MNWLQTIVFNSSVQGMLALEDSRGKREISVSVVKINFMNEIYGKIEKAVGRIGDTV